MTTSFLSRRIGRTSELLKVGAEDQVTEYERRFSSIAGLYDRLLSSLLISNFSYEKAHETVLKSFGSSRVHFAGVDGTMYSNPLYDLMIFFGGAYAHLHLSNRWSLDRHLQRLGGMRGPHSSLRSKHV